MSEQQDKKKGLKVVNSGNEGKSEASAKAKSDTKKWALLVVAVIMDGIGMLSYLIPGFGELIDVVWAPIASIANFLLYRGWLGAAGATVTLVEEALPGTDFIPTFTLVWCVKYLPGLNKASSVLQPSK